MFKCNEDSSSDQENQYEVSIERSLIIQSKVQLQHLICPICHHIIYKPITCGSPSGCHTAFCSQCIQAWLKKSPNQGQAVCPQCKRIFQESNIPPILKSLLESMKLHCVNFSEGCFQILRYDQIEKHLKVCAFRLKKCQGCRKMVVIKDFLLHTNNCDKYIIQCPDCSQMMPKNYYLTSHTTPKRSQECYQSQITHYGNNIQALSSQVQELNTQSSKLESITNNLLMGQPLDLCISFYTTFNQHFAFPNPTLIKPSFNQQKEKFDFLHFYIVNPIYTDSIVSMKWSIKINKMIGNILLGFCSSMNINSLDFIVNKYGELKRKDIQQSKYKILRKNQFSFNQGDIIKCRYISLLKVIRLENQTKKLELELTANEVQQFSSNGKIYVFFSMDTLNDSISFIQ